MTTQRLGEEGLRWFIAIVENVNDPQQLGRVQIRVINENDHPSITTDELLWATPIQSITSAAYNQVGESPTGLLVGSHVFGFYLDGHEKQLPLIWGSYAKLPDGTQNTNDVSNLARGKNTITVNQVGPEPASPYAAKYPYNNVRQTQSGHVIELDDTPSNERIRIYHKVGNYIEIDHTGQQVTKVIGNDFDIVVKDKTIYVSGSYNVQSGGNTNIVGNNNIKLSAPGGTYVAGAGLNSPGAIGTSVGASGTFSTPTGQTVHVVDGIIVNIN